MMRQDLEPRSLWQLKKCFSVQTRMHDDDDLPTKRRTGFVTRQEREVAKRRTASDNALLFTKDELQALVREIRLFRSAVRKERHAASNADPHPHARCDDVVTFHAHAV